MDAVGPEVDVMLGGEIALAPARMLLRPGLLEPSDGGRRQPAGIFAEQRDQRLLKVASGDPLEVEVEMAKLRRVLRAFGARQQEYTRARSDSASEPSTTPRLLMQNIWDLPPVE